MCFYDITLFAELFKTLPALTAEPGTFPANTMSVFRNRIHPSVT